MTINLPPEDPLGTDLRLSDEGDLVITVSGSLDLVTLTDNVRQAIKSYLGTIPDTYQFGDGEWTPLGEFVDRPITDSDIQDIKSIINGVLSKDERIQGLQSIAIDSTSVPEALLITVTALVNPDGQVEVPVLIGKG